MRSSSIFRLLPFLLAFQSSFVASTPTCDVATLSTLLDPSTNTTVKLAASVAANGTFGEGYVNDPEFPENATALPALCAVKFSVTGPDGWVLFHFGMFLPDTWNQRMMGAGNTGFGGGIDWAEMSPLTHYGFATVSTDTGHLSGPGDASWANNAPIHQALWGGLAMHQSVVLAKQVIKGYYGHNATYSYFSACSGGGRQGLKEVQDYPEDYDGVIAGAAPWLLSHLHPWAVHVGVPNLLADDSDNVTDTHFDAFALEVVRQCDPQDGQTDGVVTDPYGCQFDYTPLLCNSTYTNTTICFSTNQLTILKATYTDWTNTTDNTTLIFPSFALTANAEGLAGSAVHGVPADFGTSYVDNFVMNDTNWDWHTLNDSTVTFADKLNPGSADADDFDLSSFKNRGGKLITYHGLSDPLIPTGSSIYYYEHVLSAMSNNTSTASQNNTASTSALDDFYRLFLVPGMGHCSWTTQPNHPWFFAGAGQPPPSNSPSAYSVPGFEDAQHDIVLAVMAWVENGTAPASLTATEWNDRNVEKGVSLQRPVCPYPQQARFLDNGGPVEEAASWGCASGGMVGYENIAIAAAEQGSAHASASVSAAAPTATGTGSGGANEGVVAGGTRGSTVLSLSGLVIALILGMTFVEFR